MEIRTRPLAATLALILVTALGAASARAESCCTDPVFQSPYQIENTYERERRERALIDYQVEREAELRREDARRDRMFEGGFGGGFGR